MLKRDLLKKLKSEKGYKRYKNLPLRYGGGGIFGCWLYN